MKRHPALQDLSRDHHLVLQRCQKLRRALGRDDAWAELKPLLWDLIAFYESDMKPHFREEDELVVPEAAKTKDPKLRAVAARISKEHEDFRERFAELARPRIPEARARALLLALEPKVTQHVREEEQELFEGLQAAMPEADLQALWRRSFEFRKANRSPAACGVRPRSA